MPFYKEVSVEIKYSKKKHELRDDPVMDAILSARQFTRKNINSMIGVVVAALLIWGGITAFRSMQSASLQKAQDAFGKAMIALQSNDQSKAIDGFTVVVSNHKNTPYAVYSCYVLGEMAYKRNQIDEAMNWFKSAISQNPGTGFIGARALEGMGLCYETKKEKALALEYYQKAIADKRIAFRKTPLLWRMALINKEMGNATQVSQLCKQIVADTVIVEYRQRAENLLSTVTAQIGM